MMSSVSVHLSITSQYCTKMAKCRIIQTMTHNSQGSSVFLCQRVGEIQMGSPPTGGIKYRWGRLKLVIFYQYLANC